MAVEKLFPAKFAKIKLHQDALQKTFSVFLDIFYPPIFRCFDENGVFQQPRLFTTVAHDMAQYTVFFGGTLMARVFDEAISLAWLEAAKDLGIRVAAPFTVHSDEPITYEAHVMDFGGPKGTVVGVLDDKLDDCRATQGFYRSNLASSYRHYERQHFVATLNDWGWYGPEELRPVWYTGKSWS